MLRLLAVMRSQHEVHARSIEIRLEDPSAAHKIKCFIVAAL